MSLQSLGYNARLEQFRTDNNLTSFDVGRVVAEHRERYTVATESGEVDAEITGNLLFTAAGRADFPAVGDWVAITVYDSGSALIHHIFPRSSTIARQAVGQHGEIQIIATNVDVGIIVQAADRDFNLNRLDRYLTLCHTSKVLPVAVITKTDLSDAAAVAGMVEAIGRRHPALPVVALSNLTGHGMERLKEFTGPGKTVCLLGSSGAGKSSLINNLSGRAVMHTDAISQTTGKGRHVTTFRHLVVLEEGGVVIDNPGMREVGIADESDGLENTFTQIVELAGECHYRDCTHTTEKGCAVLAALESGVIAPEAYNNYLNLLKEKEWFESTAAEKREKDRQFGKMMKNFKKGKNDKRLR